MRASGARAVTRIRRPASIAVVVLVLALNAVAGVTVRPALAASPLVASLFASPPIAVGGNHACALPGDGTVLCWGDNVSGQLGYGQVTDPHAPAGDVFTLRQVIADSASTAGYDCAMTSDSTATCSGPRPLTGVMAIAAGYSHTCALLADRTVKCWGTNAATPDGGTFGRPARSGGMLGDGTEIDRSAPVTVVAGPNQAAPLSGVTALSAANGYTCALLQDGSARCWGAAPQASSLAPVTVMADATHALSGIVGIGAGDLHACALLAGGSVACWGADESGQLGDQGSEVSSAMPVKVTVAGDGTVGLGGIRAIAVGHDMDVNENGIRIGHSCALDGSRGVLCWGVNDASQLGSGSLGWAGEDGDGRPFAAPVVAALGSADSLDGVTAIAAGNAFTCALMSDGGVKCWGMGYGAPVQGIGAPVPVTAATQGFVLAAFDPAALTAAASLGGVVAIAAGGQACAVLADGTVKCWTGESGAAGVLFLASWCARPRAGRPRRRPHPRPPLRPPRRPPRRA